MNKKSIFTMLVILFLTFAHGVAWCAEVGETLPDFIVQTFDGKGLTRADFAGKPFMLVFWNTWCSDCMRELPQINRLSREFGQQGLKVLAVNTALNDNEGKARAYWKKNAFQFPSGYDRSFELGSLFKVRGVPTLFLVDSRGIVRFKQSLLPRDIDERIKQLTLR